MAEGPQRRLAAILAADIAGYSRLIGADEEGTLAALRAHRDELIDALIDQHSGRIANTAGDSILMEFPSAVEAVRCAITLQQGMAVRNQDVPTERRIEFRMGINVGDVVVHGDDLLGDGVNIAARLESLSDVGSIALSANAHGYIDGKIAAQFTDLGEHEVKNIAKPVRVWCWHPATDVAVSAAMAEGAPRALPDKPSIAVLPFANMSSDPEQDYFADGMTDDLITHLSKVDGLFVIARNSAFTYKNINVKVQDVAADLGVRYILEGSVRRGGAMIRINAQLIDASTGGHIWADIFDRDSKDVFALQDEVTGEIVTALKYTLGVALEAPSRAIPTANQEAYDIYLRARLAEYQLDTNNLATALSLYQEAITKDPTFADAYSSDARVAHFVWSAGFFAILGAAAARRRAETSLARALSLQPGHSEALLTQALIHSWDGNHDAAILTARGIVATEPNNAPAHYSLAYGLAVAGKADEAMREIENALRLDPKPDLPSLNRAGIVYFNCGKYEHALTLFREIETRSPNAFFGHNGAIVCNAKLGRSQEAQAALSENFRLFPGYSVQTFLLITQNYVDSVREHLIGAMLEGGVPEWPFDFKGVKEDRLNNDEIGALFLGRIINGELQTSGSFELTTDHDGHFSIQNEGQIFSGRMLIEDDARAVVFPDLMLGRKHLQPVYRDPENSQPGRPAYFWASHENVFRFSVAE
jgi:TolB-like protein/class 3 adenylate cyclase